MNKSQFFIVTIAALALNIPLVEAQPMGQKNLDKPFKEMDADNDGTISKAEFDEAHSKHFYEMDTDKDNKLSSAEMVAGHQKAAGKIREKSFNAADADKNGVLTREEVKDIPRLSKGFDKMDTNKDGKLSREEMQAAMQKRRAMGE